MKSYIFRWRRLDRLAEFFFRLRFGKSPFFNASGLIRRLTGQTQWSKKSFVFIQAVAFRSAIFRNSKIKMYLIIIDRYFIMGSHLHMAVFLR